MARVGQGLRYDHRLKSNLKTNFGEDAVKFTGCGEPIRPGCKTFCRDHFVLVWMQESVEKQL